MSSKKKTSLSATIKDSSMVDAHAPTNGNDKIKGTSKADRLDGLNGNDSITGLTGNDTLIGSGGNDSLNGGKGADSMVGGTGNDKYTVDNIGDTITEDLTEVGGVDTVTSSITFSLANIVGVENLILTGAGKLNGTGNDLNNQITGNKGNNILTGGAGLDTLTGGNGNDSLDGGEGADKLMGGAGADTYLVDNAEDTITELKNGGAKDTVQASVSFTLTGNIEVLTLTGSSNIDGTGNISKNTLNGNTGNNILMGGGGNDTLNGNAGDDTLNGGDGKDVLNGGDGIDTASFSGNISDYKLTERANGAIYVKDISSRAITELHDIENVSFADTSLDISNGLPQDLSLSVTDFADNEGNGSSQSATFTLTLSDTPNTALSVAYTTVDGDALAGQDYVASAGTVSFAAGETTKTISVPIIGDTQFENDEQFFLQLTPPSNVTLDNSFPTATLVNDDSEVAIPPTFSIDASSSISEGNDGVSNAEVTVYLSAASDQDVTVNYATVNGTATDDSDYTPTLGTLTFAAGETSKTISVPVIGDTTPESDENFYISLTSPANAVLGVDSYATVTIANDDAELPSVSITTSNYLSEGDSGSNNADVWVTLSSASNQDITVDYATANGSASDSSDYISTVGTLTFAAGENSKMISVPVLSDTAPESDENFYISLTSPTNAVLGLDSYATVTIANDDAELPSVTISTTNYVAEGDSGSSNADVTVYLSAPSSQDITVDYATANGSAMDDSDYTPTTGTLTFAAGETSQTISVPVSGDATVEGDENFYISLTTPTHAVLGLDSYANVTISNDDVAPPNIAITTLNSVLEGNSGSSNADLMVTLSAPSSQDITVDYATTNGSAMDDSDYSPAMGTLTFAAGETSQTISIPVLGDTSPESDENFYVALTAPTNALLGVDNTASVTIANDDAELPSVSISTSNYFAEGDSGSSNAEAWVYLSSASNQDITVDYATVNGSATDDSDYTPTMGTLTFAAGETSQTISVPVLGDTTPESDENFYIALSSPTNALIGTDSYANVTIGNDDATPPTIAIGTANYVSEGDSGSSNAEVWVYLSSVSNQDITVDYATVNGSASDSSDYSSTAGTLTFAAGETGKMISVPVLGDTAPESDETFFIALSNPSNALLGIDSYAAVTITNDDVAAALPTVDILGSAGPVEGIVDGVFVFTLDSPAPIGGLTVNYALAGTATLGTDYSLDGDANISALTGSSFTIAEGQTSATLNVNAIDDGLSDPDETIALNLFAGLDYQLANSAATLTISDAPIVVEPPLILVGDLADNGLIGGAGDDMITGRGGKDTLTGGDGADTFIYNLPFDSKPDNFDIITDFIHSVDKIDVGAIFGGHAPSEILGSFPPPPPPALTPPPPPPSAQVMYNNGLITFDVNGDSAGDFAISLTGAPPLDLNDFIF